MSSGPVLETERLVLRRWRQEDLEPFAALNGDPVVMELFPAPLSRAESDAFMQRIEMHFERRGFGMWAVEVRETGALAGLTGLAVPGFDAPFMPAVEVGWRLAHSHWGKGYAPEAAAAALTFGFSRLGLREIVSFTAVANHRSRRVMEKLGMRRSEADDFDHPLLPPGHHLRRHVLYRMRATEWLSGAGRARSPDNPGLPARSGRGGPGNRSRPDCS